MIKIGDQLPDLKLQAYHNEDIQEFDLNDCRGQWTVMLFYPADFTFVCPTELEEAAELYDHFKEAGAEILSVSTDTAFVHKAWHDQSPAISKVQYPMLADPNGKLCKAVGSYLEDEGVSLRASLIFDPDGKLVAFEMHDNSIGRNIREILRKLQASKYVREADGMVCPASWEPGKESMQPGLDLVGKI